MALQISNHSFPEIVWKIRHYGLIKSAYFVFLRVSQPLIKYIKWTFKNTYSQHGEDVIIDELLCHKKKGFYVDVGANDPININNTYRFYKRGWRGINIEPSKKRFNRLLTKRPRDTNLNIGVGNNQEKLNFYSFEEDVMSTFSKKEASFYKKLGYRLESVTKIETTTLRNIFNSYCKNTKIDFMSIDTEGYDMEVLMSNNWNRFKPKIICIEARRTGGSKKDDGHEKYLDQLGYKLIRSTGLNAIYKLQ